MIPYQKKKGLFSRALLRHSSASSPSVMRKQNVTDPEFSGLLQRNTLCFMHSGQSNSILYMPYYTLLYFLKIFLP